MSEWHALVYCIGFLVGFGVVFQGWFRQTSAVGVVTWVGTQVATSIRSPDASEAAKRLATVAVDLHLVDAAYWFAWGAVTSAVGTFLVGAGGVYWTVYRAQRRARRPDAVALAGSRVTYFIVHGVKPYLDRYSMGAIDARAAFGGKRLNFNELVLIQLRRAILQGALSPQEVRDACEQVGATMLTLLFEQVGALAEYRLAVYRVSSDGAQLSPIATVSRRDWRAHSSVPLERATSFVGAALDEGEPLVYPRDKKLGRKFQKRGKSRWKSFLVMPIPCDASVPCWGAVTVDHTGGPEVFNAEHIEAVRDYARFVEMLLSLVDKEQAHEREARAS